VPDFLKLGIRLGGGALAHLALLVNGPGLVGLVGLQIGLADAGSFLGGILLLDGVVEVGDATLVLRYVMGVILGVHLVEVVGVEVVPLLGLVLHQTGRGGRLVGGLHHSVVADDGGGTVLQTVGVAHDAFVGVRAWLLGVVVEGVDVVLASNGSLRLDLDSVGGVLHLGVLGEDLGVLVGQ
jgi:hypothetical protein